MRKKLESGYSKLHTIGENNIVRKKREESRDIYKNILKVKAEEMKAEQKAIEEGLKLPPPKTNKKASIFFTEI